MKLTEVKMSKVVKAEDAAQRAKMLKVAKTADKGRKDLIAYLKGLPEAEVADAGIAARLPKFAYKLHRFPGDISTAMLVKVMTNL